MTGTDRGIRVLVVEDDLRSRTLLTQFLTMRGFEVREAADGVAAIERAAGCDVALVDVGLPGVDGWQVAEVLRRELPEVALVFVTGAGALDERLRGFGLGAQDFVVKPYDLIELEARLKVVVGRSAPAAVQRFADLRLDLGARVVERRGERLDLTELEFELLALLASQPMRLWTREELLRRVWANYVDVGERTVDVRIRHLRAALDDDAQAPTFIETVRGRGYRWVCQPAGA
jgi:two-component system, OmpR family, alkaline phosphatase synthesis response regulator PhoP